MFVLTAAVNALALTDGQTYAEVNGIKIANQWIFDRVHCGTEYTDTVICNQRLRWTRASSMWRAARNSP